MVHFVDGERVKTRGGKKKRKRPVGNHYDGGRHHRSDTQEDPKLGNLFKPLKVTAEDSEEVVAKEIAWKLNEVSIVVVNDSVSAVSILDGYKEDKKPVHLVLVRCSLIKLSFLKQKLLCFSLMLFRTSLD